jgi:hypothetical protein
LTDKDTAVAIPDWVAILLAVHRVVAVQVHPVATVAMI